MSHTKVCVKVPASTANLGPGFDVLGMALDLYAWIEMSAAEQTTIVLVGEELRGIPTDKSNLIYVVAQKVFTKAGVHMPELQIAMYSDIPLTRGLGSSASAIVGALVAANALAGYALTNQELFMMATELEKHPDNVGASLFGGIVVCHWDGGAQLHHIRLQPPSNIELLVAIPDFKLSTETAREVVPKQISLHDAVLNIGRSSLLTAAFATGQTEMIAHAMKDSLHQPFRAPLIPGMEKVLEQATEHGALGVALSGAGPTLLTLVAVDSPRRAQLERFLQDTLSTEGITAQLLWLKPDTQGVRLLTAYDQNSTLFANIRDEVRR